MYDFFSVPPSIRIISLVEPNLSSYCTIIGCEGGRISKNAIPCNHKFFVPHLAIYTVSFHSSIWEKFSYDLWVDNPNRVQQLGPSPFFKHLRDEGVLKSF